MRGIDDGSTAGRRQRFSLPPTSPFGSGVSAPCLVALYRDVETDAFAGIHRIALTDDVFAGGKVQRRTLGPWPTPRAIKLWKATDQLFLAEGIETTLAAATRLSHHDKPMRPAWAAGSAGNITKFPVLADVKQLTLLVDHDAKGEDSANAFLSSAEFVASYVPPDYLIEGLLQRKFFYSITGKTGAGKTAIALLFCALVATGRVLDGRQFERGRVLYLAGENPVDVQQRWIAMSQQMDFDADAVEVHFIPGVFKISAMQAAIAAEVEKLGGVALVVIDTTAAYFEGDEENSNTQAGNYARMQRSLIDTLPGDPTILALCHPVKNAADDNLLPRGGGAYLNEVDGNLTALQDDGVVQLHWQGKFRGPDFAPITFRLRSVTHERLKDSKGRLISTVVASHLSESGEKELRTVTLDNENQVLRILANNEELSYAEIAEQAGWINKDGKPNKTAAFRMVRNLKKAKLVRQGRTGLELTEAGQKTVKGNK